MNIRDFTVNTKSYKLLYTLEKNRVWEYLPSCCLFNIISFLPDTYRKILRLRKVCDEWKKILSLKNIKLNGGLEVVNFFDSYVRFYDCNYSRKFFGERTKMLYTGHVGLKCLKWCPNIDTLSSTRDILKYDGVLTNIKTLTLYCSDIQNLSKICPNVKNLNLFNWDGDLHEAIDGLFLEKLKIRNTYYGTTRTISLRQFKIKELHIEGAIIVESLPENLITFHTTSIYKLNISPRSLRHLYLSNPKIASMDILKLFESCPMLKILKLICNDISNAEYLKNFKHLKELSLWVNAIDKLPMLSGLTRFETCLPVERQYLETLFQNCPNLKHNVQNFL